MNAVFKRFKKLKNERTAGFSIFSIAIKLLSISISNEWLKRKSKNEGDPGNIFKELVYQVHTLNVKIKVGVPGRESLGEDKILNKAPSLKPLTKLRSKSCNIGVLTEAKAIKQ